MSAYPAVTELVPHAAPMLAIEELLEWRPGFARARLVVHEDSLFQVDGRVDSVVTFEYMAQTVAACLGMDYRAEGGAVRAGMVTACRDMRIERPWVAVGEELFTRAERTRGVDYLSQFVTEIEDAGGERIATARMTLIHGEPPGPS